MSIPIKTHLRKIHIILLAGLAFVFMSLVFATGVIATGGGNGGGGADSGGGGSDDLGANVRRRKKKFWQEQSKKKAGKYPSLPHLH